MTTIELASLILTAEFALVAAAVLYVMRRRERRAAESQRTESEDLRQTVQGELPSRREALTGLFKDNARLKGRQLSATVDQFIAREQAFYEAMLNIYLNKNEKSLSDIPDELRKVLAPWAELQRNANEDSGAVGELRVENAELSEQIEHNKQIIQRLLEEYDATFNKFQRSPDAEVPPLEGILEAAEAAVEAKREEEKPGEQLDDLLAAQDIEVEEDIDAALLADPVPTGVDDEGDPVIFSNEDDQEELADLFDAVPHNKT